MPVMTVFTSLEEFLIPAEILNLGTGAGEYWLTGNRCALLGDLLLVADAATMGKSGLGKAGQGASKFAKGGKKVIKAKKLRKRQNKFKGRDALRRENKQARQAADKAGLNLRQKEKFHDQIHDQGYTYPELVEIAEEVKKGHY